MDRAGRCLCGAVSFTARNTSDEASVCHCSMCLRWAGGPFISLLVESIDWDSNETVATVQSSKWAERGFCTRCGSSLFFRMIIPGKYHGITSVALGCFDDKSGLTLTKEWFIDNKPDLYTLAGERATVTEAEALAVLEDAD